MPTGLDRIGDDSELQDHWLKRVIAFIIDSVLLAIILGIIFSIVAFVHIFPLMTGPEFFLPNIGIFFFPFYLGIISFLYFVLLDTFHGKTLGKSLIGLRTQSKKGGKPSIAESFIRNVSKVHWIILLIDVIIGMGTKGNPHQKLTDRLAGTIVISSGTSLLESEQQRKPEGNYKYCPECGEEIPKESKFCPNCGKEL